MSWSVKNDSCDNFFFYRMCHSSPLLAVVNKRWILQIWDTAFSTLAGVDRSRARSMDVSQLFSFVLYALATAEAHASFVQPSSARELG
jgi:hypothetical protein